MARNPDSAMCCTCLSTDRRTFPLGQLRPIYQLLSEATPPDVRVCWECRAVLDRLKKFRLQVSQAQYFMTCLTEHGLHLRGNTSLSRLEVQAKSTYDVEYEEWEVFPGVDLVEIFDMPEDIDDGCVTADAIQRDKLNSPSIPIEEECEDNIEQFINFVPVENKDEVQSKTKLNNSKLNSKNVLNTTTTKTILSQHKKNTETPSIESNYLKGLKNIQPKTLDLKTQGTQKFKLRGNFVHIIASNAVKSKLSDQHLSTQVQLPTAVTEEHRLILENKIVESHNTNKLSILEQNVRNSNGDSVLKLNDQPSDHSSLPQYSISIQNSFLNQPTKSPNYPKQVIYKVDNIDIQHSVQSVFAKNLNTQPEKTYKGNTNLNMVSNQLEVMTTERQLMIDEQKNNNVNVPDKTDNVEGTRENNVLQIVYSEKSEANENIVVLGSHTYNPDIPIALTDDEDEQDYQDDSIDCQDEEIETADEILALLETIKTETSNGRRKKGKPDKAILDKLDPLDRFGVDPHGRGVSFRFIGTIKKMLNEGKLKRTRVTINDVKRVMQRGMTQLKGTVCKFCCVRICSDLAKHVWKYHTDAAGPHVCALCNRHFRTAEEQSAHYQRHFYMYQCNLGCKRSITPSIWHAVAHVNNDESVARRRNGIVVRSNKTKIKLPRVDDAVIETLDALDRFGMRITQRKINEVKKLEEEGTVERFVATLSELMEYRKMEKYSYAKVNKDRCLMCLVTIPDSVKEEHLRVYHSEAAGPHVCAICSCHFNTEELQSAHYQRHFNMYRCRMEDCQYVTPSIKKIYYHVSMKRRGFSVKKKVFDGKCDICGGVFLNPAYFRNHYKQHISTERYECDICGKVYNTRLMMSVHLSSHNKKYVCEHCGYRTDDISTLKSHALSHKSYEERQYLCNLCNKRFAREHQLRDHKARHSGKTFLCEYCEFKYINKYDLKKHVKKKHPEQILEPSRRAKETLPRTKSLFRNPKLKYPSNTRFACGVCGKEFKNNTLLKQHSIIHTRELPYKCDECKIGFKKKRSLDIHIVSHSGEKPYACDKCEKRYTSHIGLRGHCDTKHANIVYECTLCGVKFRFPNKLKKHMSMKHSAQSINQTNAVSSPNIERDHTDQDVAWMNHEVVDDVACYEIVAAPGYGDNTGLESEEDLKETPWINEEALRQERTAHIMVASSEITQENEEIIYEEYEIPAEPAQHRLYRDVHRQPTGAFVRSKRAWEQAALQDRHRDRGKTARLSEHSPYHIQRGCSDPKTDWDSIIPQAEEGPTSPKAYGGKTGWKSEQVVHLEPTGRSE